MRRWLDDIYLFCCRIMTRVLYYLLTTMRFEIVQHEQTDGRRKIVIDAVRVDSFNQHRYRTFSPRAISRNPS
jgi:hypothetical protein